MTKLKIGDPAPNFALPSHLDKEITLSNLRGQNVVIAFFPLAWTPIWTGQIPSYEEDKAKFTGLDAQVLGISVDSVPCLKAWADDLGGISYPLLSDFWPHGEVAQKFDVLREEGYTERALFILDKQGFIQYIDIHDIDEQPSNEVLLNELRRIDPAAAAKEPKIEKPVASGPLPSGGVVMYCTSWCPGCRRARLWFNERGIQFTEVDINATPGAAEQVMKWNNGNRTTPTFDVQGDVFPSFDEQKLLAALKKHNIYG